MPDEVAAGCLLGLFRFLVEFIVEWCGEWFFGYLGKWTLYALSLGRCDRDHEDIACILTGILVFVGFIVLVIWLGLFR